MVPSSYDQGPKGSSSANSGETRGDGGREEKEENISEIFMPHGDSMYNNWTKNEAFLKHFVFKFFEINYKKILAKNIKHNKQEVIITQSVSGKA